MDFNQFLLETKFAKLLNALRGDVPHINQMGIITANNPLGNPASAQENNTRNRELLKDLRHLNYQGHAINPQWLMGKFGNIEDSYFVPHIDRTTLISLAARFGQKSVIWGQKKDDLVQFEYIESSGNAEPLSPDSYTTTQTRNVVISGKEASEREDMFSAAPFPASGIDKRTGQPVTPRKFVIPFFDPEYEKTRYSQDKRGLESAMPDLSFIYTDLPDTPEVKELVEEIQRKETELYTEGKMPHWYWRARGSLEVSLQKLREILKL
jgi:hypothetical protein